MTAVVSTRCTYAAHEGLPELPAGEAVPIPDSLLPLALGLQGVVEVKAAASAPFNATESDLPETSWERQSHPDAKA